MKKIILSFAVISLLFSCEKSENTEEVATEETTQTEEVSYTAFGSEIDLEGAISSEELMERMKSGDSVKVKVTGIIDEVCQAKGCWMDIKAGEDDYFTVRFKDYGFFMPKDAAGREATFEGVAFLDTLSVEALKHYAEDAGKSEEEIAAITEPEVSVEFTANGVLIKDEK